MIPEPQSKFGRKANETATAEELLASLTDAGEGMPQSKQAEEAFLAGIFQDPQLILEARLKVLPQAFYTEETRTIYEEMLTMDQEELAIEPVSLDGRLSDQGKIGTQVGRGRVLEIATSMIIPAHFARYREMIAERWTLRKGIHGHLLAVQRLFRHLRDHAERPAAEGLTDAASLVQLAIDGTVLDSGTSATLKSCLDEHIEHMSNLWQNQQNGEMTLIPTGFPTLDRASGGIARNEYWLITGPTKAGKSVLAGQIIKHAAGQGRTCKIYTNEVTRVSYAGRFLASESKDFDGSIERQGFRSKEQMGYYQRAVSVLMNTIGNNVIIDNAAGKYVEDIIADMRMEARRGVSLFVVDLIGKVLTRASHGNRERELAHISGRLSDATKVYDVACVVVAQENDEGAVRESKAIAMDCEAWLKLVHVYRDPKGRVKKFGDELASKEPELIRDRRNIVVQLARGFASGDVIPCFFDGPRFLLGELARDHQNPN